VSVEKYGFPVTPRTPHAILLKVAARRGRLINGSGTSLISMELRHAPEHTRFSAHLQARALMTVAALPMYRVARSISKTFLRAPGRYSSPNDCHLHAQMRASLFSSWRDGWMVSP